MVSDSENERSAIKDKNKKLSAISVIAKPLAGKKLSKRTLKLVRRGDFFFPKKFHFYLFIYIINLHS